MSPTFPAVIPTVRKKPNSKRSLALEGTELNKDEMKIIWNKSSRPLAERSYTRGRLIHRHDHHRHHHSMANQSTLMH